MEIRITKDWRYAIITYEKASKIRRFHKGYAEDVGGIQSVVKGRDIPTKKLEFGGFPPNPDCIYCLFQDNKNNWHMLRMCKNKKH